MTSLIVTRPDGTRLAYVGHYTVRERVTGLGDVYVEVDGDEVLVERFLTFDEALAYAAERVR